MTADYNWMPSTVKLFLRHYTSELRIPVVHELLGVLLFATIMMSGWVARPPDNRITRPVFRCSAVAAFGCSLTLATLDPLRLLDEIRTMQKHIAGLAAGQADHVPPHRDLDLDQFMASLSTAWRAGEVRPTHKPKDRETQKGIRHWRTRKDPFEDVWPNVLIWLETEPDRTAKELLERLREDNPGPLQAAQLRTLQRRVKEWRRAAAQRLVFVASPDRSPGPLTGSHASENRHIARLATP